jgi:hypothetical protein
MSGTNEKQKRPSTQAKKTLSPAPSKERERRKERYDGGEEPWDGKQQQNSGIISSRPGLTLGEINKFPLLEPLSNPYILIPDSCS